MNTAQKMARKSLTIQDKEATTVFTKVKGVNDFPSRANDLENLNKDVKIDGL